MICTLIAEKRKEYLFFFYRDVRLKMLEWQISCYECCLQLLYFSNFFPNHSTIDEIEAHHHQQNIIKSEGKNCTRIENYRSTVRAVKRYIR